MDDGSSIHPVLTGHRDNELNNPGSTRLFGPTCPFGGRMPLDVWSRRSPLVQNHALHTGLAELPGSDEAAGVAYSPGLRGIFLHGPYVSQPLPGSGPLPSFSVSEFGASVDWNFPIHGSNSFLWRTRPTGETSEA